MSAQRPKKVLIVSPHFPPVNAPDMQRARLAIPYLERHGWEPVVLALEPDCVEGAVFEPLLLETYPPETRVVRVRGLSPKATRWAGIGNLWLRCGSALRKAGDELLSQEQFDLVFFSTTQFETFTLGPRWLSKFGVPYVVDYQDPWVNDYYRKTGTRPPGGWIKFNATQWLARRWEAGVLRGASGVISVSDAYGPMLAATHLWFDASSVQVIPFGASAEDIRAAKGHTPSEPLLRSGDGYKHIVYTGRCGPDMSTSLTILFRAFKRFRELDPVSADAFRFHFVGTDYAPRHLSREWVMPIAIAEGVADRVSEYNFRVPYFDALSYMLKSDALVAVGSNDPTYSASKIFNYILTQRPLLVIFNSSSPLLKILDQVKFAPHFDFDNDARIDSVVEGIAKYWFSESGYSRAISIDTQAFLPFTAEGMTERLVSCFDAAVSRERKSR